MGNQQTANGSSLWMNVLLLVFFIGLMYFMLIRPQRKRDKETSEMRNSLKKGDKVVTIGGIVGTINKINGDSVILEVGKDRIKLELLKTSIANVLNSAAGKAKKEEVEEEEEVAPVSRNKKISPKKISSKKKDEEKENSGE